MEEGYEPDERGPRSYLPHPFDSAPLSSPCKANFQVLNARVARIQDALSAGPGAAHPPPCAAVLPLSSTSTPLSSSSASSAGALLSGEKKDNDQRKKKKTPAERKMLSEGDEQQQQSTMMDGGEEAQGDPMKRKGEEVLGWKLVEDGKLLDSLAEVSAGGRDGETPERESVKWETFLCSISSSCILMGDGFQNLGFFCVLPSSSPLL